MIYRLHFIPHESLGNLAKNLIPLLFLIRMLTSGKPHDKTPYADLIRPFSVTDMEEFDYTACESVLQKYFYDHGPCRLSDGTGWPCGCRW